MPVLIEVNTSGEPSKNGCAPEECRGIVERCCNSGFLVPCGYMTIGPFGADEITTRKAFALLRSCAENNRDLIEEPHLSMGMSGDFEVAIDEGATIVRIGTAIFGPRL